jgi:hypothetical protein
LTITNALVALHDLVDHLVPGVLALLVEVEHGAVRGEGHHLSGELVADVGQADDQHLLGLHQIEPADALPGLAQAHPIGQHVALGGGSELHPLPLEGQDSPSLNLRSQIRQVTASARPAPRTPARPRP